MSQEVQGNTKGLAPSELKQVQRLFHRRLDPRVIVPLEFARELYQVAAALRRRIGVLVSRKGEIEYVVIGSADILYLPDLGRVRLGKGRLRRLRLLFSDLSAADKTARIPQDIYTDLEKLRLDMVVSIRDLGPRTAMSFAHLVPARDSTEPAVQTEIVRDLSTFSFDFVAHMEALEEQLEAETLVHHASGQRAVLVGVYDKGFRGAKESMAELRELARSAGVGIAAEIVQYRQPDPRTLIGGGKLEEVVLQCLRLGVDMVIFDAELRPTQWRSIVNSTELKVLDRSMVILDIFAQRATSSDGRLQVELAQLKYNLPRLTEQDSGLSRLSGGIGGRGPGETKLEVSRRRARDRIADLERRIEKLGEQRALRRERRKEFAVPVVALVGYTNVGKSTLFNALAKSEVRVENKLFATLDPARRRITVPVHYGEGMDAQVPLVLADTVGFIRDLPKELTNAFRATLEEVGEASLILHVLDASDPLVAERRAAVEGILEQLGFAEIPQLVVFNKIDRITPDELSAVRLAAGRRDDRESIAVAAVTREGFPDLFAALARFLVVRAVSQAAAS